MGRLTYNRDSHVDIDDRALLHLQYVIGDKLRRGESFMFSWVTQDVSKPGLRMVWINANSTLTFSYHGSRVSSLNRAWLEALAFTPTIGPWSVNRPSRLKPSKKNTFTSYSVSGTPFDSFSWIIANV